MPISRRRQHLGPTLGSLVHRNECCVAACPHPKPRTGSAYCWARAQYSDAIAGHDISITSSAPAALPSKCLSRAASRSAPLPGGTRDVVRTGARGCVHAPTLFGRSPSPSAHDSTPLRRLDRRGMPRGDRSSAEPFHRERRCTQDLAARRPPRRNDLRPGVEPQGRQIDACAPIWCSQLLGYHANVPSEPMINC